MTPASVGIFWGIPLDEGGFVLLADKSPCDQGEPYGDAITHPIGHAEFWEDLARLGPAGLERHGLPTAPAWHPYEAIPRGRVVYWPKEGRFTIYADRRLQTRSFIARIVAEFGIPTDRYVVRFDPHYRAARDLP
ncbi:hypothetical protein H261_16887 [Paramagnetospirillum caucaseum]|uniref:Uncharacterized protein n=2 Tax=Paramagnetospirillum caucaseum TaxID=1244869 RepID=M2ZN55_9PROT|nr:hypothetical protein H261_16887 [Paramagnetospirillum caucaseum]